MEKGFPGWLMRNIGELDDLYIQLKGNGHNMWQWSQLGDLIKKKPDMKWLLIHGPVPLLRRDLWHVNEHSLNLPGVGPAIIEVHDPKRKQSYWFVRFFTLWFIHVDHVKAVEEAGCELQFIKFD